MIRESDSPYSISYRATELSNVAKDTKHMPDEFIAGHSDVTPAFLDYVRPLVGELPNPGRLSDFPAGS